MRSSPTFQFPAQQGEIDGRLDEVWTHAPAIFITFVGTDEGDEVGGAEADVGYNAADDTITDTTCFHQGDDLPFVWLRVKTATKPARKRTPTGERKKKK